ncbi:hypothetical protein KC19_VG329600 [Ceratodon purpureus]|uniref:Uncharacterized protein n=1 Tax=Ceratodon purpureus TaxID=3225 RepID=A0A8T0HX43_CERPU|nr:hypothetical protein KC19_VG329600 [Ceratodon purpureus]
MTVNRTMDAVEVLLGSNLPGSESDLDKGGVLGSPDGEIKRVICQKQRQPEPEVVENPKSRLRVVSRSWEATKGDAILEPEVLGDGEKDGEDGDEQKLKPSIPARLQGAFGGPLSPRSPARGVGRDEHSELLERNRFLEAALKKSAQENEAQKREFEEEKNNLLESLERLELANEQLLAGGENSGMEQLQMELTRLQKHNTVLSQRERELQFQLSTKDMLQKEVQHLQELNEQLLETRLPQETESESGNKMLDRIVTLETELAEAMEVNNLYKAQLHTAFADEKNVQAAAPAWDEEVTKLRAQVKSLETDLQELRDRYFVMSIRLAEREAQHEEAMMRVRRLQSPIKHFSGSFKW